MSSVHFILTGGTIDSFYDGMKDTVTLHPKSVIPSYIKNLKLYDDVQFTEVCMKDSRDLTQKDLANILRTIESSDSEKIIITHGTYTMPDTARYLQANLKKDTQTIIFTAATIPLQIINSDAGFNLGFAFSQLQYLNPGVYVAMNGRVFSTEEVSKNIAEGRFISIFSSKRSE